MQQIQGDVVTNIILNTVHMFSTKTHSFQATSSLKADQVAISLWTTESTMKYHEIVTNTLFMYKIGNKTDSNSDFKKRLS